MLIKRRVLNFGVHTAILAPGNPSGINGKFKAKKWKFLRVRRSKMLINKEKGVLETSAFEKWNCIELIHSGGEGVCVGLFSKLRERLKWKVIRADESRRQVRKTLPINDRSQRAQTRLNISRARAREGGSRDGWWWSWSASNLPRDDAISGDSRTIYRKPSSVSHFRNSTATCSNRFTQHSLPHSLPLTLWLSPPRVCTCE